MRLLARGVAGLLMVGIVGCGKAYLRQGFEDHPPQRVAVLPFVITYQYDLTEDQQIPETHQQAREIFRKTFYENLTPYGYEDVPPAEVDAKLAAAWGADGWPQHTPQEIGALLGADALIYGDIARLVCVASPAYTQTSIDATLRMVDAASGEELWRNRVDAVERGGAAMQKGQVVDFLKDQVRSFHPEEKFQRVADVAARRVLKGMPNPEMTFDAAAPSPAMSQGSHLKLAILPLGMRSDKWRKPADSLRMGLAANLQAGAFAIVELRRVDAAVKSIGWTPGMNLTPSQELQLAQMLGADALLRGTVTNWGRTYLVVQSWVKAAMELELMDANSGKMLWTERKQLTRQSGITKGPTGFTSLATGPIKGLKPSNLNRVAMHLARDMAQDMLKAPEVQAYINQATQAAAATQ